MNINQLGGLLKLTENQGYWLGYCNRLAENAGYSKSDYVPKCHATFNIEAPPAASGGDRIQAYLLDSLMVGLYTQEPVLALRVYAQVMRYLGKLQAWDMEYKVPVDAVSTLRVKVENLMGTVT